MKKKHLILLVATVIAALSSAYSLAAINQVYRINFEWYSQLQSKFNAEFRDISADRWHHKSYQEYIQCNVLVQHEDSKYLKEVYGVKDSELPSLDFKRYVYLYCRLLSGNSPEYRLKVASIAQRGNVVEVKLSLNSPATVQPEKQKEIPDFSPRDMVRIDKDAFPIDGQLLFIFKDQDGRQIFQKKVYIYSDRSLRF